MNPIIQSRLSVLQADHLPQPILDYIEDELGTASAAEIKRRLTPAYLVEVTGRAIKSRPRSKRQVAIQAEFSFIAHLERA